MVAKSYPRILLISQWPAIKNAEYELIEKIKKSNFKVKVTNILGFDVSTNKCYNHARTHLEFDFAIALHYETPKLINVPTFLWVSNPPDFVHAQKNYRDIGMHDIRSFDGYLFNGSEMLAEHLKLLIKPFNNTDLYFYPSSSISALLEPEVESSGGSSARLFYCGIFWDRFIDDEKQVTLFFELLDKSGLVDLYGPEWIKDQPVWKGIKSYVGEIPFDGESLLMTMKKYGAILAISSPSHLKAETASSRVFEGLAAGVPVISDNNPYIEKLFGDNIWYFDGETITDKVLSIQKAFDDIQRNPRVACEKVRKAQLMMMHEYCFEPTFEKIYAYIEKKKKNIKLNTEMVSLDIVLLEAGNGNAYENIEHILSSAKVAIEQLSCSIKIISPASFNIENAILKNDLPKKISSISYDKPQRALTVGSLLLNLLDKIHGDYCVFLTQNDFPQYDFITKALVFYSKSIESQDSLYIAGFFESGLNKVSDDVDSSSILRNNASSSLYRWSEHSLADNQLGSMFFSQKMLKKLINNSIFYIDQITPIYIIGKAISLKTTIFRDRYITLRIFTNKFLHHYMLMKAQNINYNPYKADYNRELNALYEIFIESSEVIKLLDKLKSEITNKASIEELCFLRYSKGNVESLLSCPENIFISVVYKILLKREVDPSGKAHYEALLRAGESRKHIIKKIMKSEEYVKKSKIEVGRIFQRLCCWVTSRFQ